VRKILLTRGCSQQCPQCTQRKNPTPKKKAKLTSIKPGYPLQLVAVDILGPLPESNHKNSYVLVVSDYFTRSTEAYALPNQEAHTSLLMSSSDSLFQNSCIPTKEDSLSQQSSKKSVVSYKLRKLEQHLTILNRMV